MGGIDRKYLTGLFTVREQIKFASSEIVGYIEIEMDREKSDFYVQMVAVGSHFFGFLGEGRRFS
ncbi:hypothetical protein Tph_c28860 [Thermacetogenium phaeum DSM 12270]|uniref:Uncharacterized protein n=2 Tax=Thermacetogenium phaeum TaxID=85874 RepID=K4LJ71_THEPS|nr:hypothetical protein Tph_c28860 [Thermacetogenium phaeum DSM 12270]